MFLIVLIHPFFRMEYLSKLDISFNLCLYTKYKFFLRHVFNLTASSDNMARLWAVDTGEVKKEYSGHQKAVVCLAFRDEFVQ